jgi:hypothetical protein
MQSLDQIEALALHEEAIGKLYQVFANRFPDYKHFWNQLADEEKGHAILVRSFRKLVEDGRASVDEGRFRIKPIEKSLKFIDVYTRNALRDEMTILNALSISHDLESGLLEKKFLDIYDTDDEELQETLNILACETKKHRELVESRLKELRLPM